MYTFDSTLVASYDFPKKQLTSPQSISSLRINIRFSINDDLTKNTDWGLRTRVDVPDPRDPHPMFLLSIYRSALRVKMCRNLRISTYLERFQQPNIFRKYIHLLKRKVLQNAWDLSVVPYLFFSSTNPLKINKAFFRPKMEFILPYE
jgi:hypothetical protein